MYFHYGDTELDELKRRDSALADVIQRLGHIDREVDPDLFSSVVHHIVGQQISTKAQATIWRRMLEHFGHIDAPRILSVRGEELQSLGISFRKADYIQDFARKVQTKEFDLEAVSRMSDQEAIGALVSLRGIGVWTAEMILLFGLQRPDILSFDDLAIHRGLRMVHHHRTMDRKRFETYRRRYSPYGSVASLYLWAVAGGAIPELRDFPPGPNKQRGR